VLNQDKRWLCESVIRSIKELSQLVDNAGKDPFPNMPFEQRLEYINDLALGAIDLLDPVGPTAPELTAAATSNAQEEAVAAGEALP
jgi:hypothetical protein